MSSTKPSAPATVTLDILFIKLILQSAESNTIGLITTSEHVGVATYLTATI